MTTAKRLAERPALRQLEANLAHARRVLELSARHQLCFEFTAEGWRMRDDVIDLEQLPPPADYDVVDAVAS